MSDWGGDGCPGGQVWRSVNLGPGQLVSNIRWKIIFLNFFGLVQQIVVQAWRCLLCTACFKTVLTFSHPE